MSEIDISGIDKVALVQALYASAQALGLGRLHYQAGPLPDAEAQELACAPYIDYCHGRVMKVDISGDTLDPWGYDRDNGAGAAEAVVATLRAGQAVVAPEINLPTCAYCSQIGVAQCADCTKWLCRNHGKSRGMRYSGGTPVFSLDPICRTGCAAEGVSTVSQEA